MSMKDNNQNKYNFLDSIYPFGNPEDMTQKQAIEVLKFLADQQSGASDDLDKDFESVGLPPLSYLFKQTFKKAIGMGIEALQREVDNE